MARRGARVGAHEGSGGDAGWAPGGAARVRPPPRRWQAEPQRRRFAFATIIDGKAIAEAIRAEVKEEVGRLRAERRIVPGLRVILVGDDPASHTYVRSKRRAAAEVGIDSQVLHLPAGIGQEELHGHIDRLNADPAVHAILIQSPLPPPLREEVAFRRVRPEKDVDGFHPMNVGLLHMGEEAPAACTPLGIMEMLRRSGIEVAGKEAVVIGRSNIVGRPMAALLLRANATVTICHSRTRDLPAVCRRADILVAAVGRPRFVQGDWVKPGATVIDVGINRVDGRIVGDVDFEAAAQVAGHITPVPGGVGPMTIAMLLWQTVQLARRASAP